jgi:putative aldouronate transport system permease protein
VRQMKKKKTSLGDWIFNIFLGLFFTLFTLICIYPFYYLIINTISANDISANGQIMFLPKGIHFQNYIDVFKIPDLASAALVSLGRTVLGTIGAVLGAAYLGFMFTQQKMWARKFWYRFTIITMYFNAGLIPWYITMRNLHLTNNFLAYILPAIVQPFNIILVKTYMESISPALQEAAEIDGASVMKVFMKIMLPLAKPIMATIAIFAAVGQWNSFQDTLILMTKPALYTLQFLLYQYINQASSLAAMIKNGTVISTSSLATMQTPTSIRMTVSVVVILPILLVYPFFQKYFVKGIMIGSVKG